jgi:3-oxoacyl-[acyl-carrier protein] reductase
MVGRVLQEFGTIDILVNNAAIGAMYDGMETPQAIWDKMMNINARGVHNCCCAVSRVMIEKKKGAIVNINTVTSAEWAPRQYMYSVSKAAARHITTWLGRELIPYGIRVNAVAPGNINTKMSEHTLEGSMPFDHSMSFLSDKLKDIIPIGRVCEPVDVARVVLFLASDAAGYIAGQTIRVTGN